MRTIMVELFDDGLSLSNDTLGRAGEKNVVQFSINFDALRDTGLTTATLLYQPRNSPVLAMPSVDIPAAGRLISHVPDWAMSMFGVTQVQLQLTGEGVETRSYIWHMRVERSLINYGDKPTPLQDWLQEVRDVIDDAASLTGFKVIDYFDSYDELIAAITDPVPGAAYGVGTAAPYDVYVYGETSGWTNIGPIAVGGGGGESIVYVPSISKDGVLTWENNGDLPNPAPINIKGPKGDNGGAIFIPSVSDDGVLSWTNTGGLNNPPDVNLMGKDGTAPKITVRSVSTGYELLIDHPDGLREVVPIKNGSAPSVVVEEIDGGHRITIYGGNGPKSFDVLDGASADENRFSAAEERLAALEQDAAETDGRITALEKGAAETDDRVSVLEQDMAEVKKITDNFELFVPKFANTAEGEMLVLTDSADGALQGMTVYGKTTQETLTGKNLLNINTNGRTYLGVTFTANADGSVTCVGTSSASNAFANLNYVDMNTLSIPPGTYIVSGAKDGVAVTLVVDGKTVLWQVTGERTVTIPETAVSSWMRLAVDAAGTTVNTTIYPMIRRAEIVDSTWEPYTGGIPSPNPDYPQPLNSVGDDGAVDVTIEGSGVTQTLTLSTPNGLPSVGDVCDEIDLERGVYVQRVLKTQLTSAMGWYAAVSGKRIYTEIKTLRKEIGGSILCSHAVKGDWASDASGTICMGNRNAPAVGFSTVDFATVDAVKAFLDANDVYIVAPLITPIETPLSAEEIAAFKALKTYYPDRKSVV